MRPSPSLDESRSPCWRPQPTSPTETLSLGHGNAWRCSSARGTGQSRPVSWRISDTSPRTSPFADPSRGSFPRELTRVDPLLNLIQTRAMRVNVTISVKLPSPSFTSTASPDPTLFLSTPSSSCTDAIPEPTDPSRRCSLILVPSVCSTSTPFPPANPARAPCGKSARFLSSAHGLDRTSSTFKARSFWSGRRKAVGAPWRLSLRRL